MRNTKGSPTLITRYAGRNGRARLSEALLRQGLFSGNPSLARRVSNQVELIDLRPNECLANQGDLESDIYFILGGTLSIRINDREIATRGAGEHVGEMAMVDTAARRSASLIARDNCTCAKMTDSQFTRLASRNPQLWRSIAVKLADRLRERSKFIPIPRSQPTVFIGSSSEGLEVAQSIHRYLNRLPVVPILWSQGVFQASSTAIEELIKLTLESDFAIIVLTPDDMTKSRGTVRASPRDNAIFELGLFMGALHRDRTYFVCPSGVEIKIPTDLLGVTRLQYQPRGRKSLNRRLRSVKQHIQRLINMHGPR